jgi:hypothetical protein
MFLKNIENISVGALPEDNILSTTQGLKTQLPEDKNT